jgi:hypothetical protein
MKFCRWASIKMGDLWGIGGCLSCFQLHGLWYLQSSQVISSHR